MVENIADAPQLFPLGRTHGYSAALGYAVLARILEVADGKTWDDALRDRIFVPLGLTSTNTRPEQVDRSRAATGHLIRSLAEGPIVTPIDYLPRAYGPGGGITSTIGEVLALAQVLLNDGVAANGTRVLSAELVREMKNSRGPGAGSAAVRTGMGAGAHCVRLARPNRLRDRQQHDRPEFTVPDPAGIEHRRRGTDQRRAAGKLLPHCVRRNSGRGRSPSTSRTRPCGETAHGTRCPPKPESSTRPCQSTRCRPNSSVNRIA